MELVSNQFSYRSTSVAHPSGCENLDLHQPTAPGNQLVQRMARIASVTLIACVIANVCSISIPGTALLGGSVIVAVGLELAPLGVRRVHHIWAQAREWTKEPMRDCMEEASSLLCNFWVRNILIEPQVELPLALALQAFANSSSICFANQLPQTLLDCIAFFTLCNIVPQMMIENFMGIEAQSFIDTSIVGPILEEAVFRLLIQEILLRRLPKMILRRIAPFSAWLVDSRPAKVARIVSSSALFALAHLNYPNYCEKTVVPQFLSGLILGVKTEASGNILASILGHMGHNGFIELIEMTRPAPA